MWAPYPFPALLCWRESHLSGPPTSGFQVGLATGRHLRKTGDQSREWWSIRTLCSAHCGISAGSHVPTEAPAPLARREPPRPGAPWGAAPAPGIPAVLPASDAVPCYC